MSETIGMHGLIGDLGTAALVSHAGRINWLCWPEFDSPACFAALLGTASNGLWQLSPKSWRSSSVRYLNKTLLLETTYTQRFGATVTVIDFMPIRSEDSAIVRMVRGEMGRSRMYTRIAPRFNYGSSQARIERLADNAWSIVTGPHRLVLRTDVFLKHIDGDLEAEWTLQAGETCTFTLQHTHSYRDKIPHPIQAEEARQRTVKWWNQWVAQNRYKGMYRAPVERSLITLKALTDAQSGGSVAAPTASLPEKIGGPRNWDYRFCWLRDTTFKLISLLHCGYEDEAKAWLNWFARTVQGDPKGLKTLYAISGKQEHSEWKAAWLNGYRGSKPVNVGNAASDQLQLDIYGEIMDTLYYARRRGMYPLDDKSGLALEVPLLEHLATVWEQPDDGIWEFRSGRQQFTQSKVMAWVAFDRGIRMVEECNMKGPVERWRKARRKLHAQICRKGFNRRMNSFTQVYGEKHLDASLLLLPLVGFLPPEDPRITGTINAIENALMKDGLLLRYDTGRVKDGFPPGEGCFLPCNFWLVEAYMAQGRTDDAQTHFERLLSIANDVGLLSEEVDREHGLIGNFPQALSHIGLINAALSIERGNSIRLLDLIGSS